MDYVVKRVFVLIIFFVLIITYMLSASHGGKHVLYISSYNPSFPTFNQQVDGIKSVFDKEDVLLDIEFMDTKRFPERENIRYFHNLLTYKLAHFTEYNAVIVADDAAFRYAVAQSSALFKNIPLFFCGVNDLAMAEKIEQRTEIRGIVEEVSMKETLQLIRDIFPERKKIAVIADGTISGLADLKNFITVVKNFPFDTDILTIQNLTFSQLNLRLRELENNYTILLLSAYTDCTGSTRLFHDEFSEIYHNSHVPVFHLWEHGMGNGVFGGKLIRHSEQGREAALLVMNYFRGKPLREIRNVNKSPNIYCFDYNELVRFNIPLSVLPEGSLVINRPPSFFEEYKRPVIAAGLFILSLFYVIIVLIYNGRRLKKNVIKRTGELAESEAKWKFYLDVSGQIVWDWNLQSNKIFTSRKWNDPLWLNNEETLDDLGERIKDIHPEDIQNVVKVMTAHLKGIIPVYECLHRVIVNDGTYRWVLSRGKTVERLPEGRATRIIGTATDVTQLKKIESDIIRSRKMLQIVLDTIPVGVFWKDMDLTYIGCNNACAKLIGVEFPEQVVGKKDVEMFDSNLAEMYNKTDREVLDSGYPKLNYEEEVHYSTGRVIIFRKSKVPLTGNDGEIIGLLGTYEDITEQKIFRDEMFKIQKLESVGILASGIAHDFNNLLMEISGSLSVMRYAGVHNEKCLYWLEHAEKSCFAATELTTRLITFAQGGAPVLQRENIADVVNEAIESGKWGERIEIHYSNESQDTSVMIDARQIRQVVINLVENAKEAMREEGVIDIVTSEIKLDDGNMFELEPGRYMAISVKDNGSGIPESIIDKIFDPYFSTKQTGKQKGQGLGLAICHSIIVQHRGKISVNSTPGEGAVFTIYIPFGRE